jgi:alpha-ketoglutarate-dependent taurine dioxygenase
MRNSRIEVRPIAGACGAEIDGVRIGGDLDDATIARSATRSTGIA